MDTNLFQRADLFFKTKRAQASTLTRLQLSQRVGDEGLDPNALTLVNLEELIDERNPYAQDHRWSSSFGSPWCHKAFKLAFAPSGDRAMTSPIITHHIRLDTGAHSRGLRAARLDHMVSLSLHTDGHPAIEHHILDESFVRCVQRLKAPARTEPTNIQPRFHNPSVLLARLRATLHARTPEFYARDMRFWRDPAYEAVLGLLARWKSTTLPTPVVDYILQTQRAHPFWSGFFHKHGYARDETRLCLQLTHSPFIERTLLQLKDAIWSAVPATERSILARLSSHLVDHIDLETPHVIKDALTVRLWHPLETLSQELELEAELRGVIVPGFRFDVDFSARIQNDMRSRLPLETIEISGVWSFYCDEDHLTMRTHIDDAFDDVIGLRDELRGYLGGFTDDDDYYDEEWE